MTSQIYTNFVYEIMVKTFLPIGKRDTSEIKVSQYGETERKPVQNKTRFFLFI